MGVSRDIYREDVDFAALALQSPAFNQYLKSNGQLDFSNPQAVQQLTKSLLEKDFGLRLELPEDRLCPPIPNRLNYIFWIQDLLDTTSDTYSDKYDANREIIGLDIGNGASCIYPLLGCSQRPLWRFIATDIDEKNHALAKQNVLQNQLQNRIRPLLTKPADPLIPIDKFDLQSIDFTMCNPPFYSSPQDLLRSAASKSRPPHSACTGAEVEMVTAGGEVGFVSRMFEESQVLRGRCQWYTSMLGKASSVETIVRFFIDAGITNWAVRDLVQGSKTKRWAVAWSWTDMRPNDETARSTTTLSKRLLPFPSEWSMTCIRSIDICTRMLNTLLDGLDAEWQYRPSQSAGIMFTQKNVWSRAARRKNPNNDQGIERADDAERALGVKITLQLPCPGSTTIHIRWLQGKDHVIFESFCGMIKRHFLTHELA